MVFNLAWRLSGNRADAEDIAQETFVRVFRHLGRFKGQSSLKTWIFRITINCANSRFRQQSRRRKGRIDDSEAELERTADTRRTPEGKAVAVDLVDAVRTALDRLPPHYREAVLLRDFEDMTYEEIAAVLGVRLGTVRSRIARGRDRLRAILEERS